ncbi:MAG: ParB N-terminal domain-containing protein [Sneathiella sp.]|nr:ParB N-terminal domain-containing protein [Sneathiella sp.]
MQVRADINPKTVEGYARCMKAGSEFPPVTVYNVDDKLFLIDGFHRVAAAEAVADVKMKATPVIDANVIQGTMGEAIAAAALANTTHGRPMKRNEHKNAFRMLAKSGQLEGKTTRHIADLMHNVVSHVSIHNWANKEFPDLLATKAKKRKKSETGREPYVDGMTSREIEHRAAVSNIQQTLSLIMNGRITDEQSLHDIAALAKGVLDKAIELGGDPDHEAY